MITKEDNKNIERIVKENFETLEWDIQLADEKLKKLDEYLFTQEHTNIISPIYATAIMKAYLKYFGLSLNNFNVK